MFDGEKRRDLHAIAVALESIARSLRRAFPGPISRISIQLGGKPVSASPFVLQDNQKVPYLITAVDADGNPTSLPAGATIAVKTSDPTIATVVPDATPATGSIASGSIVGQSKLGLVQISAAVTNADGTPGPTGQTSVQVVAGAAATIAIALGTPAPQ
jgi:hypothetical protein